MNKIGIYYAFWTHDWDADFIPYCAKVKSLGFDILEVNAGTVTRMSTAERATLRRAAESAGVELTYCIGLTPELDPSAPEEATRRRGIKFLQEMALAVREMGNQQIGGIVYSSWPGKLPWGADKRAFVDRSIISMKEVAKTAEDCGVYFNLEVVNRFEQFILNTSAEAVDFVTQVGSPNCRILLDCFHMNIEEDSFRDAITTAGSHLGHFHLGETNRRAPGRGRIPWDEIGSALKEINYPHALTMEPFLMPGGEVGRDISVFRDLKGTLDLDQEAQRACSFVRSKLR